MGSIVGFARHHKSGSMTTRSNSCHWGQNDDVNYRIDDESIEVSAVVALVGSLPVAQQVKVDGSE